MPDSADIPAGQGSDSAPSGGSTLHDLVPEDEMPREKLFREGCDALTDEELIAIFLRTGLPGVNVIELSRLLKKHAGGSLTALGRLKATDIMGLVKGIRKAKAATLAAAFELGRRAVKERLHLSLMNSPEAVYRAFAGELRYAHQENFLVLSLNTRNELIFTSRTAVGTLTRVILHPRDVFREAIRHSASRIILVHNHPSGNPLPSIEDRMLTDRMVEAGKLLLIPVADHVIIGTETESEDRQPFFSFHREGLIPS